MVNVYDKLMNMKDQSKLLLGLIQKKGPVTRNQIMDAVGMKLTTLKRFMQPLLDEGFIIEADMGKSTGGRPPKLYDVNPKGSYVIGIDISRTYTETVITNLKMGIIDLHRFESPHDPADTVNQISLYVKDALCRLGIAKSLVLGAGIGTVGPLDRKKGIILNPANFPSNSWINVPINDMLRQRLGLPIVIDNGANAAVLAEHLFGTGKGIDNISYFHCGVGIRTGAISSGNIVRAINEYEDAFGHMIIDINGELCHCKNRGCIETMCSIPSITKKFKKLLEQRHSSSDDESKSLDRIDYLYICNAAEQGDKLAKEVILNAATHFGIGLANYINLINPELVVLSGPIVEHSPLFYKTAVEAASKRRYIKSSRVAFSRGGYFKDKAIAVGAAALLVEETLVS
ncbi:ROK family transcriptional regulator [Tepidanaerobacter acetatoxydans]|uniref:ROK family transcriptional regulator n=1 Tax=Tepidanaerobacter acetatoxydans TaxID=499229 RepID=UPI001BD54FB1|nr:ROK family transcriptional regulator [Tepidanaerobacter acetatoxydans]